LVWKTGVAGSALKACHGWEDNIEMNLNKTMGERALDSCDSGQGRNTGLL